MKHDLSSVKLPDQFEDSLQRFLQPFLMQFDNKFNHLRVKRDTNPLVIFFQYIFTDQDQRVQSLEGNQKLEISTIKKILKQDKKLFFFCQF